MFPASWRYVALTLLLLVPTSVFAGLPDMSDTLVVLSGSTNDGYGAGFASAGDLNGDGLNDVTVGAPYWEFFSQQRGQAYVYFTGTDSDATPDIVLSGTSEMWFGSETLGVGDMNGDGLDDLFVTASRWQSARGRGFLYYGRAVWPDSLLAADADVKYNGESAQFGWQAEALGDVNGDGLADVLVGTGLGSRAYVLLGDSTASGQIDAANADIIFDSSASGVTIWEPAHGDFNGDGVRDYAFVAPYSGGAAGIRQAFLFLGSPGMAGVFSTAGADLNVTPTVANPLFGTSRVALSFADVNDDGYDDLVFSQGGDASSNGFAYVFFGAPSFPSTLTTDSADVVFSGEGPDDFFRLWGSIDWNDDGIADLIGAAPQNDAAGTDAGRGYVFYGSTTLSGSISAATADVVYDGPGPDARLSWGPRVPNALPGQDAVLFRTTPATLTLILTPDGGTGVERLAPELAGLVLHGGSPNPFRAGTTVSYELPRATQVEIAVYDTLGRRVTTLASGPRVAGLHRAAWDGRDARGARVASGVYFARLSTGGVSRTKSVVLTR